MFCSSCGNEITVELRYCNRCGANLTLTGSNSIVSPPVQIKFTLPTLIMGLTIVIGLGIVFSSATRLAEIQVHPAAIAWMVLFGMLTLFGSSALILRFWLKLLTVQRQNPMPAPSLKPPQMFSPQQLPPRYEPVPSVTEHTTRTFSPVYREPSEPR